MSRFCIQIAGHLFAVESLYPEIEQVCADYLADPGTSGSMPEETFEITAEDLQTERRRSIQEAVFERQPIPLFPPAQLEVTAVLRKTADWLSRNNGAVIHGVLLDYRGRGVLFTAPSGTGKSTHGANWLKRYPECRIINGDKPVIIPENGRVIGYGTPWAGKEGIQINDAVPLEAIVFLRRTSENSIGEINSAEAVPKLVGCIYRGSDSEGVKRAALTAAALRGKVKFYSLGCNMDPESAEVACRGIFGEENNPQSNT